MFNGQRWVLTQYHQCSENVRATAQWNSLLGPSDRWSVSIRRKAWYLVVTFATVFNPVSHSEMPPPYYPNTNVVLGDATIIDSWLETSQTNRENVRSLRLDHSRTQATREMLEEICSLFPNVECLVLHSPVLTLDNLIPTTFTDPSSSFVYEPLKRFSQQLTSLTIERPDQRVHPVTLRRLIHMFPKLDDVTFDNVNVLDVKKGTTSIPPGGSYNTPNLGCKLTLLNIEDTGTGHTIDFLAWLRMAFVEMRLEDCSLSSPKMVEGLFVACGETAKKVEISKVKIYNRGGSFHWCSRVC